MKSEQLLKSTKLSGSRTLRRTGLLCLMAVIPFVTHAADKTWTGNASDVWDLTSLNWHLGGTAAAFEAGDNAMFDGTGASVTMSGSFAAGTVTVDSASDYTITSSTTTRQTTSTAAVGLTGATRLVKKGTGKLTLIGLHNFSGDIEVHGGTLVGDGVGDNPCDVINARNSPFGDPRVVRSISVYTNATLQFAKGGLLGAGTSSSDVLADVYVHGGTLEPTPGKCTTFGNLYLADCTVNMASGQSVNWRNLALNGTWLEFGGTHAITLESSSSTHIGIFAGRTRPIDFRVPDITGDNNPDVIVKIPLFDPPTSAVRNSWATKDGQWYCNTNVVKTGEGTLRLEHNDSNFVRDFVVSNGTLVCGNGWARIGASSSVLGDTTVPHTIYVEPGATIVYERNDVQGQFYNDSKIAMHIRGGTLMQNANRVNGFGPVIFENATLSYSGVNGAWPTFGFSEVTFMGTNAYVLPNSSGSKIYFGANRMGIVCVSNIVSGVPGDVDRTKPDVTIDSAVTDCDGNWVGGDLGPRPTQFRKTGHGVLRLGRNDMTYTGNVEIAEGVVTFSRRGASYGSGANQRTGFESGTSSALGNLATGKRVTVYDTGELYIDGSDAFGQACSDFDATFAVSNGTLRFASGSINGLPRLELYDPQFEYGAGVGKSANIDSDHWGLWALRYPVSFDGTQPIDWPNRGSYNVISLGYSSDTTTNIVGDTTNYTGRTEFKVADITGDGRADVKIGLDVQSLPHWDHDPTRISKFEKCTWRCGLLKTGPGTLELSGRFTCPQPTRIIAGALLFGGTVAAQQSGWAISEMQVESGAFLGGTGTVENVTILAGGGLTATTGQNEPLKVTGTLTTDGVVPIDITNAGADAVDIAAIKMPVLQAANVDALDCTVTVNGQAAPPNWAYNAYVQDGVLWCRSARKGLTVIIR